MTPLGVILVLGLIGSLPFPSIPFSSADDSYQVVFEDVGQVATSVSYLHLAVDLHFPEVKKALDDYLQIVKTSFAAIGPLHFPPLTPHLAPVWTPIISNFTADYASLFDQFNTRHGNLLRRYNHFSTILPLTAKMTSGINRLTRFDRLNRTSST